MNPISQFSMVNPRFSARRKKEKSAQTDLETALNNIKALCGATSIQDLVRKSELQPVSIAWEDTTRDDGHDSPWGKGWVGRISPLPDNKLL